MRGLSIGQRHGGRAGACRRWFGVGIRAGGHRCCVGLDRDRLGRRLSRGIGHGFCSWLGRGHLRLERREGRGVEMRRRGAGLL